MLYVNTKNNKKIKIKSENHLIFHCLFFFHIIQHTRAYILTKAINEGKKLDGLLARINIVYAKN